MSVLLTALLLLQAPLPGAPIPLPPIGEQVGAEWRVTEEQLYQIFAQLFPAKVQERDEDALALARKARESGTLDVSFEEAVRCVQSWTGKRIVIKK